jgi:peptidoglycan lytic transglycosylase
LGAARGSTGAAASGDSRVSCGRGKPRRGGSRVAYRRAFPNALVVCVALSFANLAVPRASASVNHGLASWYGEEHRGKLMANGKPFNPDKYTAASWYFPLGTKVRVTLAQPEGPRRSVVVTITDRGPAREYVRDGRIIDLSRAPFKKLAPPRLGLVVVAVQAVR